MHAQLPASVWTWIALCSWRPKCVLKQVLRCWCSPTARRPTTATSTSVWTWIALCSWRPKCVWNRYSGVGVKCVNLNSSLFLKAKVCFETGTPVLVLSVWTWIALCSWRPKCVWNRYSSVGVKCVNLNSSLFLKAKVFETGTPVLVFPNGKVPYNSYIHKCVNLNSSLFLKAKVCLKQVLRCWC